MYARSQSALKSLTRGVNYLFARAIIIVFHAAVSLSLFIYFEPNQIAPRLSLHCKPHTALYWLYFYALKSISNR